ncbi:amino acid ABC transporter substrate-binding protein [Mesorhizobium sp. LHD-90]|uniref:amino acid ABC transporter substrate-binding protein n=1 Tax=Mesorhizobium sp. LHD-90 TaxID=3071414 RepID=UPI0027DEBAF9|nr:amino acid ABC transporter substrate-binding protein [Mesorhizobium sp. LHD-90]MDQ6436575.1 amino acid ABC transporter substrate-binding protein [Mesorhizobium sp. LHD-90]
MFKTQNTLCRYQLLTWLTTGALLALSFLDATSAGAATLDRIRQAGKVTFGFYDADARPFSFAEEPGKPTGYTISLCEKIAEEIRAEVGISELAVEWIPVAIEDRYTAIEQGKIDLLCGASAVTLERRKQVSFSIPIFSGGITVMLRTDSARALHDVLAGRPASGPIWRGFPAQLLVGKTFSVVAGTTAETWLADRLHDFQLAATVAPVEDYNVGAQRLLERTSDALFGEHSVLVEAAAHSSAPGDLFVLERMFTSEPDALAVPRNDDDFRLVVDRSLSRYFGTDEFRDLYAKWFGRVDETVLSFFRKSALPE